ncbi:MAG: hypothetical protein HQK50_08365 [Oligoflexia bacterium]|nr:hypothetical protein [Oligoflexia bacterium]MBF0365571.1 hypothetical protein [Oligoflexia bacterium]
MKTKFLKTVTMSLFALTSTLAFAADNVVETKIFKVVPPQKANQDYLILALENGKVFKLSPEQKEFAYDLQKSINEDLQVKLTFKDEESAFIQSVELTEKYQLPTDIIVTPVAPSSSLAPMSRFSSYEGGRVNYDGFRPSIIPSMSVANQLFEEMPTNSKRRSQCFKRAHRWTYDMHSKHGINSMKIFVFYSERYMREYDDKWWFHVAPMVLVQEGSSYEEIVLDPTFAESPLAQQDWVNLTIMNKAPCREVDSYQEYESYMKSSEFCMLRKVSMYHFQPLDIEAVDAGGAKRTNWISSEISMAQRDFGWSLF